MILSDNETKIDLLNNETIASTIVTLLRERADHPITVGIHGDWGAGKSSVLEMIENNLGENDDVLCIKFNGWRFQGFEDAKIALIEGIVSELIEKRPQINKLREKGKDIFRRIDWIKAVKKGGSLMFNLNGLPSPDQINNALNSFQQVKDKPEEIDKMIQEAESFLKPKETKNIPTEIKAFRKDFDSLLREAEIKQLIILIDDLDRCLPDTAIETLEAIRLFVSTTGTAFVVAADEAMIEYAVKKHFPDLPESALTQEYAQNYLEKLIQVPFRIPPLGEMETRIYVTLLLVGSELGDNDLAFQDLITAARKRLRKPWESTPLDAATLRNSLKDKTEKTLYTLTLADQIGPSLASGTKGNPRQIKRFLNTLLLRKRTAEARGFGNEISLPVLAKLMLAERFIPELFNQMAIAAATSPNGVWTELSKLESFFKEENTKDEKVKKSKKKDLSLKSLSSPEKNILTKLSSSKEVQIWCQIEPPLSKTDLRPYLFVTKEKKDYFGSLPLAGNMAKLAEQLTGSKMKVQLLASELKRLTESEASELFEIIRTRIIKKSSFEKEPEGVAGLTVLVKNQPKLQDNLVDFLGGLPIDKLGPWVVRGWDEILTNEESNQKFKKHLSEWSRNTSNPPLRSTAQSVQKIPNLKRNT